MAVSYVQGVQNEGVIACVKHFADNNFEQDRRLVSVNVDERTQVSAYHYLWVCLVGSSNA